MLQGLRETKRVLAARGVRMIVRRGVPAEVALSHADRAVHVVIDGGYLRYQKQWCRWVAEEAPCRVVQVEGDVVVPVEIVTDKAEHAARTIRPKTHEHLDRFLSLPASVPVEHPSFEMPDEGISLADNERVVRKLEVDSNVPPVSPLSRGGFSEADRHLDEFLRRHLNGYAGKPQPDSVAGGVPHE